MRGRTNVGSGNGDVIFNADVIEFEVAPGATIVAGNAVDFKAVSNGGLDVYTTTANKFEKYCFPLSEDKVILITKDYNATPKGYILNYNNGDFSRALEPIDIPDKGTIFFIENNSFLSLDIISTYTQSKNSYTLTSPSRDVTEWINEYTIKVVFTYWKINLDTMLYESVASEEKELFDFSDTNTYYSEYTSGGTTIPAGGTNAYPTLIYSQNKSIELNVLDENEKEICAYCHIHTDTVDSNTYYSTVYMIFEANNKENFYFNRQQRMRRVIYGDVLFYGNKILMLEYNHGAETGKYLRVFTKSDSGYTFETNALAISINGLNSCAFFVGANDSCLFICGSSGDKASDNTYKFYVKKIGYTTLGSDNTFIYYENTLFESFRDKPISMKIIEYSGNKKILRFAYSSSIDRIYILDANLTSEEFFLDNDYQIVFHYSNIFEKLDKKLLACSLSSNTIRIKEYKYDESTNSFVSSIESVTYVMNAADLRYISGIAKQSGQSGDVIEVYVPKI